MSSDGTEHCHGAFLWSGMQPKSDLPLWQRVGLLPLYLGMHGYHCIRGTPVYVQYGNHEYRSADTDTDRSGGSE